MNINFNKNTLYSKNYIYIFNVLNIIINIQHKLYHSYLFRNKSTKYL